MPGKDGKYEWEGFLPLEQLPRELNGANGYYASANNDVVPKFFPDYKIPLGFEYSTPYRYERITEVLEQDKKFDIADMESLQGDHLSLPARQLVPLFKGITSDSPEVQTAIDQLLKWDFVLDRNSVEATIYEYWILKLTPLAYALHLPEKTRGSFHTYDLRRVIGWMKSPDPDFGPNPVIARNNMMVAALEQALKDLGKKLGDDRSRWKWGSAHKARFEHPLLTAQTASLLTVSPVSRGGDAYTVQATSSPSEENANEVHGASAMFVLDTKDWDHSVGLNAPGNESQAGSPHYSDLATRWGDGRYFPLAFSRAKVEEVAESRLVLQPAPKPEGQIRGPSDSTTPADKSVPR